MEESKKKPDQLTSQEIRDKVLEGTKLAFERLLEQRCKEDRYIVISDENGRVITVRARDIKR